DRQWIVIRFIYQLKTICDKQENLAIRFSQHYHSSELTMSTQLIGARIKALREERKLSQDDLARIFGFKDRQTVSAIEIGERRLSAEELLVAIEKLGAP